MFYIHIKNNYYSEVALTSRLISMFVVNGNALKENLSFSCLKSDFQLITCYRIQPIVWHLFQWKCTQNSQLEDIVLITWHLVNSIYTNKLLFNIREDNENEKRKKILLFPNYCLSVTIIDNNANDEKRIQSTVWDLLFPLTKLFYCSRLPVVDIFTSILIEALRPKVRNGYALSGLLPTWIYTCHWSIESFSTESLQGYKSFSASSHHRNFFDTYIFINFI